MKNLLDMTGKTVLITGGSRGLGRAMALGFAEQGADIAVVSRKIAACEKTAAEVEALGVKAFPFACNVGDWDGLSAMADAVYNHFGKVDVLINNAGMSPLAPSSLETSEALFDKVIAVNFKGPFRLTACVGSRMAAGDGGSIINVSSIASIRPKPETAPYGGAKAAINSITVAHAHEYGPNVRVNCIMCGPFLTDVAVVWAHTEEFKAKAKAEFASQRAGNPEEIVTTALYLASDASSFTTGTVIRLDGGTP
jgi:NAD(P)-dependent dehydrogenase (short-subunit alcohol dehydrogenase family)